MTGHGDLPRPSGRLPSSGTPGDGTPGRGTATDPVTTMTQLLDRYAASTDVAPPPDLASRIRARIALEPVPTPPRRFVAALGSLAPRAALAAFRHSVGAAFGRGRFPAVVRAQALGLVLLVVLSVGALGAGGVVVLRSVIEGPDRTSPAVPQPSDVRPSSSPSDGLAVDASPDASATPAPRHTARPTPTATPSRPEDTPQPTRSPRSTPTPTPTSTPTRKPRVTPTPEPTDDSQEPPKTPRPTKTPPPTRTPHPTDPPEPEKTDRPETPEPVETDQPGGGGGDGWSGALVAVDLVLLSRRA